MSATASGTRVVDVALALGVTPEKVMDALWSLGVAVMSPTAALTADQANTVADLLRPMRKVVVAEPGAPDPAAFVALDAPAEAPRRPMEVPEALRGRAARLFEVAQALALPVSDLIARLPSIGIRRPADHLTQLDTATIARLVATFQDAPPESGGFVETDLGGALKRRRRFVQP